MSRVSRVFPYRLEVFHHYRHDEDYDFFLGGGSVSALREIPLAMSAGNRYLKKGTPASAANRHRGWHSAMSAPVHGCLAGILFRPRPTANGPGSLLSGVGRQEQD